MLGGVLNLFLLSLSPSPARVILISWKQTCGWMCRVQLGGKQGIRRERMGTHAGHDETIGESNVWSMAEKDRTPPSSPCRSNLQSERAVRGTSTHCDLRCFAKQIRTDVGIELVEKVLDSPVTRGHLLQPIDVPRQNTRFAPSFFCIGPLLQPIHRQCQPTPATSIC